MGCSASNVDDQIVVDRRKEIDRLPEELRKNFESYCSLKNKIFSLQNDITIKFREDYKELLSDFSEATSMKFFKMYESILTAQGITREELLHFTNENIITRRYLIDHDFKAWNTHGIIFKVVSNLTPEVNAPNMNSLKDLLNQNRLKFPTEQIGLYGMFEAVDQYDWARIFKTLKFNTDYNEMTILNFKINASIKDIALIKSFAEIIQCNLYLLTVIINVNFNCEDPKQNTDFLDLFCLVLEALKHHNNIRTIYLEFDENEGKNYPFPQSFFDLLNGILEKNILINLVLFGITFSAEQGKKFSEAVGNCSSLKFLSLNLHQSMKDYYDDFLTNLSKNKVLRGLGLSGAQLLPDQIKNLIKKLEALSLLDYREKLK